MRTIYKIAKTELQVLFYSPIAWMIIIIFTFQASMQFSVFFEGMIKYQSMLGRGFSGLTASTFSGVEGLFTKILFFLYLYIPLLTMGLMSREYSSGSIKLLYNSPITNTQIILGKYLSTMIYAFVLIVILFVFVVFAGMNIAHFDWGLCLSGLLGIYLLICVYAAIGLFMSSITSYQLVAALCTLSVLAILNYVRNLWQNIDFVRELTYWLSISGRAQKFIEGLICSEDVLYFLILIVSFLALTIIQLQAARQKSRRIVTWSKFLILFSGVLLLGYFTSRPKLMFFYDATQTKSMSLVEDTRDLLSRLEGGMTITTYGNVLADDFGYIGSGYIKEDMAVNLMPYVRFKPEIKMKYVYYYPESADMQEVLFNVDFRNENIDKILPSNKLDIPIDSFAEGINIIRVFERENGQKEVLPTYNDANKFPNETDYYVMFRNFLEKRPKVGFVTGLGERSMTKRAERDYRVFVREKSFRYSLINSGLDPVEISLDEVVSPDINIVILADIRGKMTEQAKANLRHYIDRGGNLLVMLKPQTSEDMKGELEKLGVKVVPGCLVSPNDRTTPDVIYAGSLGGSAFRLEGMLQECMQYEMVIAGIGCCGMEYSTDKGFEVIPLFATVNERVWNEVETTNFMDDTVRLNLAAGEVEKVYVTGLSLYRKVEDREQKIVVYGNADYFSNTGMGFKAAEGVSNLEAMQATVHWLTDGYTPVELVRPPFPDEWIDITRQNSKWVSIAFMGIYPGILLLIALGLWFRRRGK